MHHASMPRDSKRLQGVGPPGSAQPVFAPSRARTRNAARIGVEGAEILCLRSRSDQPWPLETPTPGLDYRSHSRADHNAHWQRIAEATERAAAVGDTRKLYQHVKQSSRSSAPSNESMLDRSGGVITSLEGQLARWEEHFAELLNNAPPPASTNSPSADVLAPTYECNSVSLTVDEIRAIIQRLKNNKSPGEDALPPEVFKHCSDILAPWLHRVITKVWELELIPRTGASQ